MEILSVNVSLPKDAVIAGKPDTTGLYKKPVDGPVAVDRDGLAGDGVSRRRGTGWQNQSVYAYPVEHYAYWEDALGLSGLNHGHFGENITVRGLKEADVHVGDVFRIGTLLLQATAPRTPCYKLADLLGQGPEFTDRFFRSGRTGIYFRVLEAGEVTAGQTMERMEHDESAPTIADFIRLVFIDSSDREGLIRLRDTKYLAEEWREIIDGILVKAESPKKDSPWTGLRNFVVARRVRESETVTSFYLEPEDGHPLPTYKPGQFLPIELDIPGRDDPVIRTYTLSDSPNHANRYRLTIKREPASGPDFTPGVASNFMHDHVDEGSVIRAKAPAGDFFLNSESSARPVALLSGGVGLTPMISMLNSIVEDGAGRSVFYIHGVRDGAEHALADHVRALTAANENVYSHVLYMEPRPEDAQGRDYDTAGVLTSDVLKGLLPGPDMDFYLCGPPPFMKAVYGILTDWGAAEERINYEFFGPATVLNEDALPKLRAPRLQVSADVTVTFSASGKSASWNPDMDSILELAESMGLVPEFSCRSGICQTCMCSLTDGEVTYPEEPVSPPDEGSVLICCAIPMTNVTVDL